MLVVHRFLICCILIKYAVCKKKEVDVAKCKSCVSVLDAFKEVASEEIKNKDLNGFTEKAKKYCKQFSHGTPFEKICYTIGARHDSSSSYMNDVFSNIYWPAEKLCLELHKKYDNICSDKVKVEIDWNDLSKYSVKQLKSFLVQENDACKGCLEKSEYIQRLLSHKPKTEL